MKQSLLASRGQRHGFTGVLACAAAFAAIPGLLVKPVMMIVSFTAGGNSDLPAFRPRSRTGSASVE
jgi:hypothetical protein